MRPAIAITEQQAQFIRHLVTETLFTNLGVQQNEVPKNQVEFEAKFAHLIANIVLKMNPLDEAFKKIELMADSNARMGNSVQTLTDAMESCRKFAQDVRTELVSLRGDQYGAQSNNVQSLNDLTQQLEKNFGDLKTWSDGVQTTLDGLTKEGADLRGI